MVFFGMKKTSLFTNSLLCIALLSIAFTLTSCSPTSKLYNRTDCNPPSIEPDQNRQIYPFTLYNGFIILTFTTDENYELRLTFDTGDPNEQGRLHESGFKKIVGTDYEKIMTERYNCFVENIEQFTGKTKADYSQAQLEKLFKKYDKFLTTDSITPYSLKIGDYVFSAAGGNCPEKSFFYSPQTNKGYPQKNEDGLIGPKFFEGAKNIIINYKDMYIEVDGAPIAGDEHSSPLYFHEPIGFYYTDVVIDGVNDEAFIDTGNNSFLIRCSENNLTEMNIDDINDMYANGKIKWKIFTTHKIKKMDVCGVHFVNVTAYQGNSIFSKTNINARKLICAMNNLGFPIFMNKIIQLDFENGKFRMIEG